MRWRLRSMMILVALIACGLVVVKAVAPSFARPNGLFAALCVGLWIVGIGGSLAAIFRSTTGTRFEDFFCLWLLFASLSAMIVLVIVGILLMIPFRILF